MPKLEKEGEKSLVKKVKVRAVKEVLEMSRLQHLQNPQPNLTLVWPPHLQQKLQVATDQRGETKGKEIDDQTDHLLNNSKHAGHKSKSMRPFRAKDKYSELLFTCAATF